MRFGLLALLLMAPLSAAPDPPSAPKTRLFAGRVAEWDAKGRSLVLTVPGSRKYPRPRIVWDAKTMWAGLAARGHSARPGDPARVTVVSRGGGFYATKIDILAPEPPPKGAGAARMH